MEDRGATNNRKTCLNAFLAHKLLENFINILLRQLHVLHSFDIDISK